MKLAIIGSRKVKVNNIAEYISEEIDEIVSGGAIGVDACAAQFAKKTNLKLTEFLPQYSKYGRSAPLKRNEEIAEYADEALAFWDGFSRGTAYTIQCFKKLNKKVTVITVE